MKIFIPFLLIVVSFFDVKSQTITWTAIKIKGVGSIDLPSSMEIQGVAYKEISQKIKEINGVSASKVIFQQKNLNGFDTNSMKTYARVFIKTEIGNNGDFKKLTDALTQSEANEVNANFESQIGQDISNTNANILEWFNARITKLNSQNAIRYGYKRQIGLNKPVMVETFLLQNNDRLHIITFEYRLDSNSWQTTFENIKKTVRIESR